MTQWNLERARRAEKKARSDKDASDEIYREAMELVFPDREGFTKAAKGQKKAAKNWDSAPTASLIKAANRLSAEFTPQFQSWAELGLGPAAEQMPDDVFAKAMGRDKDTVRVELEGITKIVQAVFQAPGFPTASNELYLDWHFGQGGMKIMPNDDMLGEPIVFTSMPLSHFVAYDGINGKQDQWFFWHEIRADVLTSQWADAQLSDHLKEEAAKPDPPMIQLVSIVYRDYDEKQEPYRYEVFHFKTNTAKDATRLVERQSRTSPFVTPRYSKLPGENRGRGPVIFAMPDIRTANKIVEMTLRAAAIAVGGIYTATDGVDSPVALKPLSVINVKSNGGVNGPSLVRLDTPQRIDFGELLLEKLQESIKKIIGAGELPPEAGPIRTATEFIERARELIADQAGGLGRLVAEFIIPAWQRVIDILERKQLLQTSGLMIDQFLVEVRMTSALAKGEAMAEVENIVRFVEMLKFLGGDQMVAFEMNIDKTTSKLGDLMNVGRDIRNTKDEKKAFTKGAARLAAQEVGADPDEAEGNVVQMQEQQADAA